MWISLLKYSRLYQEDHAEEAQFEDDAAGTSGWMLIESVGKRPSNFPGRLIYYSVGERKKARSWARGGNECGLPRSADSVCSLHREIFGEVILTKRAWSTSSGANIGENVRLVFVWAKNKLLTRSCGPT